MCSHKNAGKSIYAYEHDSQHRCGEVNEAQHCMEDDIISRNICDKICLFFIHGCHLMVFRNAITKLSKVRPHADTQSPCVFFLHDHLDVDEVDKVI